MVDVSNYGDITFRDLNARDPTFYNPEQTDASGGRRTAIQFKGRSTTTGIHKLVELRTQHEGSESDEKGQFQVFVNTGSGLEEAVNVGSNKSTSFTGNMTANSNMTVQGNATLNGATTVNGATSLTSTLAVSDTSTFDGAVTLKSSGTALNVETGDVVIGGALTASSLNVSSLSGITLEDVTDGATRQALTTGTQTISGNKSFSGTQTYVLNNFKVGTSSELDYNNTSKKLTVSTTGGTWFPYRTFFSDLTGIPTIVGNNDKVIITHATEPVTRIIRSGDMSTSTDVVLSKFVFTGRRSITYREGAAIVARTDATNAWDESNAAVAPTELQFFTQDVSTTDMMTTPRVVIQSDGTLKARYDATVSGVLTASASTGVGLVVSSDATVSGALYANTLHASSGPSTFTSITASSTADVTGTLTAGAVVSSGSLAVSGTSTLEGTTTVNGQLVAQGGGGILVSHNVVVQGAGNGITCHNNMSVGGNLVVGNRTTTNELVVNTTSTFTGNAVASSDVLVYGKLKSAAGGGFEVAGTAHIYASGGTGGTLVVDNATSVGELTGTSTATFADVVTCNGATTGLVVAQSASVGNALTVSGVSTLTGAVNAAADVTTAGALVSTLASPGSGLVVAGVSELTGQVQALEPTGVGLAVTADATIGGLITLVRPHSSGVYNLDNYGMTRLRSTLVCDANLTVGTSANVSGDLTCAGFRGTAASQFDSTLTVSGVLSASSSVSVASTLSVTGVTTLGVLTAGASTLSSLNTGNATLTGNLSVAGTTTLSGATSGVAATFSDLVSATKATGTGLSVTSNAVVGGNMTVNGNLIVAGTTTTVDTETLVVTDNMIVVNNSPSASKDSGIVMARLDSDITSDTPKESGVCDTATASTVVLPTGLAGDADDYYNSWYIKITGDTPAGASGQIRKIVDYDHASRTITLASDLGVVPDDATSFNLYNRPFVAFAYDESADEFVCVATASEPTDTLNIQEYLNLRVNNLATTGSTSFGSTITLDNSATIDGTAPHLLLSSGNSGDLRLRIGPQTKFQLRAGQNDAVFYVPVSCDDTLTVTGNVSAAAAVTVGTTLGVTGDATFSGDVSAVGTVTLSGENTALSVTNNVTAGSVTTSGTLHITGTGDLDCDGAAHFASTGYFGATLTVAAPSVLNGSLYVYSTSTFNNDVTFTTKFTSTSNDRSKVKFMEVTSPSWDALWVQGGGKFWGGVYVLGGMLQSNVPVDFNSTVDISDAVTLSQASGTALTITSGDAVLGGGLSVTGTSSFTGAMSVDVVNGSGLVTLSKAGTALNVTNNITAGSVTTSGALSVSNTGSLSVAGTTALSGAVTISASVSGTNVNLSGTLDVTGASTFTALTTHNGGIDVNAASDITSLTVSGADTALSVTHNASIGGTLAVSGTSTFTGLTTHNGGIDVNAASDITALTVSGTGTALTVTDTAALNVVSVAGTSTFTGAATFNGPVNLNAGSTTDSLTLTGAGTALTVNNDASIGGTLSVNGTSTFTGVATFNNGVGVGGASTFSDEVTFSNGSRAFNVSSGYGRAAKMVVGSSVSDSTGMDSHMFVHGNDTLIPTLHLAYDGANDDIGGGEALAVIAVSGKDNGTWRRGAEIRFKCQSAWSNVTPKETKAASEISFHVENGDEASYIDTMALSIASNGIYTRVPFNTSHTFAAHNIATFHKATTFMKNVEVKEALSATLASGTGLAVTANATVGGTLSVTGATTLNSNVSVSGTSTLAGAVSVTGAGTGLSVTNDASVGGNLTVVGNLEVQGTTTTINSTTLQVDDKNVELGAVDSPTDVTADGGGLTLLGTTNKTLTYDNANTSWDSSENLNVESGKSYRIEDREVVTATEGKFGVGAGDGMVYLGDSETDGSWRFQVSGSSLVFARREGGVWVAKQGISA